MKKIIRFLALLAEMVMQHHGMYNSTGTLFFYTSTTIHAHGNLTNKTRVSAQNSTHNGILNTAYSGTYTTTITTG